MTMLLSCAVHEMHCGAGVRFKLMWSYSRPIQPPKELRHDRPIDDDAEFGSVVVAVAARRALDTGGLLCGGRDVAMDAAKSLI